MRRGFLYPVDLTSRLSPLPILNKHRPRNVRLDFRRLARRRDFRKLLVTGSDNFNLVHVTSLKNSPAGEGGVNRAGAWENLDLC